MGGEANGIGQRLRRALRAACAAAAALSIWAVAASAALAANDTTATADGPLRSAANYKGTTGTTNDLDYYFFRVGGTTQLDLALTGLGPEDCFQPVMNLLDLNGEPIGDGTFSKDRGVTSHILYTVYDPGRYFLLVKPNNVEPCAGADAIYHFRVDASPPLLAPPPVAPGPSTACINARKRLDKFRRRLSRASSRRQRNRLREKVKLTRNLVAIYCSKFPSRGGGLGDGGHRLDGGAGEAADDRGV